MAKLTNRLHVKQNDNVQEVVCYTTQEEATPGGGEHSCYELKNNNTTCYIPLWKKSVSGGNYHTPLTIKKNNTEYWVDTLVPQTVNNLNYYVRDNVTGYETVTTLPQSNIDELTGIVASSDASYAFYNCRALTTLSGVETTWNTSNVNNMAEMFYNCSSLTSLDLSNWNTSNINNMSEMFYNCSSLTSLDLSNWNTSNDWSMEYMFYNCSSLTSLDLSNWNTSNVTRMSEMFCNCSNLVILDISNFDIMTCNTEVYGMFANCNRLQYLIIGSQTLQFFTYQGDFYLNNTCKILVPQALISTYQYIWSKYASQFQAIENYTITRSNGQVTVTPK